MICQAYVPPYSDLDKKRTKRLLRSFCGGEREIRTLGTGLPHTRFPVVRLRPAQPSLHADLYMIPQLLDFVKPFFQTFSCFFQAFFKNVQTKAAFLRPSSLPFSFPLCYFLPFFSPSRHFSNRLVAFRRKKNLLSPQVFFKRICTKKIFHGIMDRNGRIPSFPRNKRMKNYE